MTLYWISNGFPTESAPETVYIELADPVTVVRFRSTTQLGLVNDYFDVER